MTQQAVRQQAMITGVGVAIAGLAGAADLLDASRPGGFDPEHDLQGRHLRHKDRASRLALRAVEYALGDAGLGGETDYLGDGDTTAVAVSSNLGSLDSVCEFVDTIAEGGVAALSPLGLPKTSSNVIAGAIAIQYHLRGPNLTLCNGLTSGLDTVHWAATLIAAGRAEVVVVVGVEPSSEVITKFVGAPVFDGAVALVLESQAHAEARGGRPRAGIAGYARSADLDHAVTAVLAAADGPVGLSLCGVGGSASIARAGIQARQLNLQDWLGECSGALGIVECAAGVAYLDGGAEQAVLALDGGSDSDAGAAVLLNPVHSTDPVHSTAGLATERDRHPMVEGTDND